MKMKKLAAAVGVALTLGIASQANAIIELKADSKGDALLFPVAVGLSGFENYYAIMNNVPEWIQGHIRFRGASWCGELRDFDVILSPGDVFVFRIADIDGDGQWEIDQSLDEKNFQYTGLLEVPDQGNTGLSTSHCTSAVDGSTEWKCMDPSYELIPEPELLAIGVDQGKIDHQKNIVHFEFIAEAVLNGMDHNMMAILLSGDPGLWAPYQTDVFSGRGTNAWKWSNAEDKGPKYHSIDGIRIKMPFSTYPVTVSDDVWVGDRGLRDVGNWLSGVGFISTVGMGMGLAYNAETLVNFRTPFSDHRVDNYRVDTNGNSLDVDANGNPQSTNPNYPQATPDLNRAVIVHDENGGGPHTGTTPEGDYVYRFTENANAFESRISFNNTWGPTLADGDDYDLTKCGGDWGMGNIYHTQEATIPGNPATLADVNLRCTNGTGSDKFFANCGDPANQFDDWDLSSPALVGNSAAANHFVNSIAEVEEAIRVGGQFFNAYYFDDAAPGQNHRSSHSFKTWFFSYAPTKFFYAEGLRLDSSISSEKDFQTLAIKELLELPKTFRVEVWDINETPWCSERPGEEPDACISPFTAEQCEGREDNGPLDCTRVCGEQVCVFPISYLKGISTVKDTSKFNVGRSEMLPTNNDPVASCHAIPWERDDFPVLIYNFDNADGQDFVHWRRAAR